MSNFANRLKELRMERNLKQSEFASAMGVAANTVSIWERGVRKPEFHVLESIAAYFNVTLAYLLGETEERCSTDGLEDVKWEDEAIAENRRLKEICTRLIRLSNPTMNILVAAINQAYQEDAARGMLEPEGQYSVSIQSIWSDKDRFE